MEGRLFLHIGLQKTGTSFLQQVMWDSKQGLSARGVDLVPPTKLAMFRLMLDMRGRFDPAIDPPEVGESVDRLAGQLARAGKTALITQESLSAGTPEQVARLIAATGDREVHVIVTVRDLGRLIPSAWQQTLQGSGRTHDLDTYLARLDAGPRAEIRAWGTMDVRAILERWHVHVPAERIHVVTVPQTGARPTELLERFCSVIGVASEDLVIAEESRANRGLRFEQAEVLRRVNALLPDSVKRRDVYGDVGKRYFAVRVLGGDRGTPIRLPHERQEWCTSISREFIEYIEEAGFDVVGSLTDLMPRDDAFAEAYRPGAEEIAEVATKAIATMLTDRADDRAAARRQRIDAPAVPGERMVDRVRRRLRRMAGRSGQ